MHVVVDVVVVYSRNSPLHTRTRAHTRPRPLLAEKAPRYECKEIKDGLTVLGFENQRQSSL